MDLAPSGNEATQAFSDNDTKVNPCDKHDKINQ